MMIDNALDLCAAQVVTATGNSTNLIDALGAFNMAADQVPRFILSVTAVSGTAPTLTALLVGADDSGFSTNKVTIGAITTAITAIGNYRFMVGNVARKRYYRLEFVVTGTTPSFTLTLCVARDDQALQTP